MQFFYHKESDYDQVWTEEFFKELSLQDNSQTNDVGVHYGTSLFFRPDFEKILNKNLKNIFLVHGGLTFFLDKNINIYLDKLRNFDLIIVNELIAKEYFELINFNNVFFIGHGLPTNSDRYKCDCKSCYENKSIDFIFSGYVHHSDHLRYLELIKDYNHIYTSYSLSKKKYLKNFFLFSRLNKKFSLTQDNLMAIQHKTKSSICSNLLYFNDNDNKNFLKLKNIEYLKDYDFIVKNNIAPNWKGRLFELAITKTLMLVKFDVWNIIETEFDFVPNKEFIYFHNLEELKILMKDVKENFENYIPIIENAFLKIQKYNSKNYYDKIIKLSI